MILNFVTMGFIGPQEIIIIMIFFLSIAIIPWVFYLFTMQNTLLEVSPENRRMQPAQVWLGLIPLFGIVWNFFMVSYIADSLAAEYDARNLQRLEERPGYNIGLGFSILYACYLLPVLGFFTGLAGLICWVIYWIKINDYRVQLKQIRLNQQ